MVNIKRQLVVLTEDIPIGQMSNKADHAGCPVILELFLGVIDVFFCNLGPRMLQ